MEQSPRISKSTTECEKAVQEAMRRLGMKLDRVKKAIVDVTQITGEK